MITPLALALTLAAQDVRLRLDPVDKVLKPGASMKVRFTIENAGAGTLRIPEPADYAACLSVTKNDATVVHEAAAQPETARQVELPAGGFFGRVVDVGPLWEVPPDVEGFEPEGWFTFQFRFRGAQSEPLTLLVLRDYVCVLQTNHGTIAFEFFPEEAPRHVLQIIRLARRGFYNGLTFHRIIPGFMMQGGDPRGNGSGSADTTVPAEFGSRPHRFGTVSMARADNPNSASCQFFICFADARFLDGQYSAFGQVIGGEDVVREIERVRIGENDRPVDPVTIQEMRIMERTEWQSSQGPR